MRHLTATGRLGFATALCFAFCMQGACYIPDNLPREGAPCSEQDSAPSHLRCQNGTWTLVDSTNMLDMSTMPIDQDNRDATTADLSPGQDMPPINIDMPDASPDQGDQGDMQGCQPDTEAELCLASQVACGGLMGAIDRCGQVRDVAECGPCGNAEVCMDNTCVPECEGQTSDLLCSNEGAECGALETTDSCGNARQVECGACDGRNVCNADSNLCECMPKTTSEICQESNAQCGVVSTDDGCGTMVDVDCGGCDMAGDFLCTADKICACEPETEEEFCGRLNAQCGMVEAKNNCDETITVDCGGCDNNDPCNANKTCPVCQPFTDDALCANAGLQCGTHMVMNNCGDTVEVTCGSCGNDTVCNAQGTCECPQPSCSGVECGFVSNACGNTRTCSNTCNTTTEQCSGNSCTCKPETDAELCSNEGATCGSISVTDRCGTSRTVVCGSCGGGQVCTGANVCCTPQSNSALCNANNRECGGLSTTDNCGVQRTINNCGSCGAGETCAGGTCECPTPSCSGVACGTVSNACGNSLSCTNTCNATTQQCSGNSCVCKPETNAELCAAAGAGCGSITRTDRCGTSRTVSCGGCSASQVCSSNACCTPQSNSSLCSGAGRECGSLSATDNCGQARSISSCGSCGSGENCSSGMCVCPTPSCSGVACGTVSNACGNSRTCTNTCNATTQQCSGNSCVCKPETNAELCAAAGADCGSITRTDRCGTSRTVSCGGCGADETCSSNSCVCNPVVCPNNLTCGTYSNACGRSRYCSCGPGLICTGNQNFGFCEPDCGGLPC